jgi:hypothetical protein
MKRIIPDVEIIMDVLKQAQAAYPGSTFVNSLMQQYCERGSLSKKQLEGLHHKSSGIKSIAPGKLATLQAIILKKHAKHRSTVTKVLPVEVIDNSYKELVSDILAKYPQHKRVLFFKMKCDKNELLSAIERTELDKFHKLLVNNSSK